MVAKLHDEERALFFEGISYLDYAHKDLVQAQVDARIKRLYRGLMHPVSLLLAVVCIGSLTGIGVAFGMQGSVAFSVAILVYLLPLLRWAWRSRGEEDLQLFMENIHRSDKAILDLGLRELLVWPTPHPEELIESKADIATLEASLIARQQSLEQHYRARVQGKAIDPKGTA